MRNPFRRRRPAEESRTITDLPWNYGGDVDGGYERSVSQDRAFSLAPVFAAARIIADSISTLPLKAYRSVGDERQPMGSLPQWFAIMQAEGTLIPWLHEALVSLAVRGNAAGLITSRDGFGFPTRVDWWNMSDVHVDDSQSTIRPIWYWKGREVPRENIIHIPWFKVPGKVLGLSPIAAFASTINTGLYAQAYGNDWFEGGGFPPGTMRNTVLPTIDQDKADEISARVTSSIRRRRPLVYGMDWEYNPVTVPPNEAQFIETMRLSATQIANIYGLPPEDVGGTRGNSLTYATVELNQLERSLALRPWMVKFESVFAAHLPERQYVRFNADAAIRTDIKTRWEMYQIARNIGAMSNNEVRALEDRPPVEGGDDYTPLKAAASPSALPAGGEGEPDDEGRVLPGRWAQPS